MIAHKRINLFILLVIFSFCFLSVGLANAGLGHPSLHVSAYVTPSEIERGSSGELIVTVSEVGSEDWAKDVTVTPSISPLDGCTISSSFKSTPRIGESSSTTPHFTISVPKDASLGKKAGDISVRYYDTVWMDVGTFDPYYTTGSSSFTVKKEYGSIRVSSNPSGNLMKIYVEQVTPTPTPVTHRVGGGGSAPILYPTPVSDVLRFTDFKKFSVPILYPTPVPTLNLQIISVPSIYPTPLHPCGVPTLNLQISVTPNPVEVGKKVSIRVKSNGWGVEGANVYYVKSTDTIKTGRDVVVNGKYISEQHLKVDGYLIPLISRVSMQLL